MLRHRLWAVAFCASFGCAGLAAAAADPTMGVPVTATQNVAPPISINECKLKYSGGWLVGTSAGMTIEFTNESTLTADIVNFRVTAGSQGGLIRDVGSFAPGIEITHNYRAGDGQMMFSPILSRPNVMCTVDSVHFTDGTIWRPGQPAAQASPAGGQPAGPLVSSNANLDFAALGAANASLVTVTAQTPTTLTENDNCTGIATIATLSVTPTQIAFKATPVGPGVCGIDVRDAAAHLLVIPVSVGNGG